VILESGYWKDEIQKIADRMKKRSQQKRWNERSYAKVEKDVFIAFYAIRKLLEAQKLSQSVATAKLTVSSYPARGKGVTRINSLRIDEHFDFDQEQTGNLTLDFVCNQIIHSYIFAPFLREDKTLGGVLFSSDFKRNKSLYRLGIEDMIACFELVALDDPIAIHVVLNPEKNDYTITHFSTLDDRDKFMQSGN
jgi:hypothetical protein